MLGVRQPHLELAFQRVEDRLPLHPCRLHGDHHHLMDLFQAYVGCHLGELRFPRTACGMDLTPYLQKMPMLAGQPVAPALR